MVLGRKIRNRILGLLVLLSIAMILVPAIMDPGQIYKKSSDSIAVNGHGALTDKSGRMVEGTQDYSDLLSPVEGADVTPEQLAAQNAGSREQLPENNQDLDPIADSSALAIARNNDNADPFATVNSTPAVAPVVAPQPIPADGNAQVQRLKQAQAQNNTPKAQAQNEVLKSSKGTQNTAKASSGNNNNNTERLISNHAKAQANTATASSSAQSSSGFAVQVGVFSSKQNADAVVAKLKAAGISARQVPAVINGRSLIRVYAGAPKNKDAATSIARRVQQVTGTKPSVVTL